VPDVVAKPASTTDTASVHDAARFAQREADASLLRLLHAERAKAERVQDLLRLVILVALGVGAMMYAPSLPLALQQANIAVLFPMLVWAFVLVLLGRRGAYPRWLSYVTPLVDASAVTAIILCYGLIGTPSVALKAPIVLSYFAILAARPMIGSVRSAAATVTVIVLEYGATIAILATTTHLTLTLDPLSAASSANVSILDEGMKLMLLATAGIVATFATAWHERVLGRALTTQVLRDVETREVASRLQEADKLAALGTLAATIAHDVTNPLTSIALSADLLAYDTTDLEVRRQAALIASDARNAAGVVRDLVAFAHHDEVEREPVILGDVVEHATVVLRQLLRDRGVEVKHYCAPDVPAINGGAAALERVVVNLVINAAQAMEGQTGSRLVRITTTREHDHVRLMVEDTGPGIPAAVLPHVFDRFFTTKPAGKGTGLGLWMAAQVIEAHGGTITASNTGNGARFVIAIPADRSVAAA